MTTPNFDWDDLIPDVGPEAALRDGAVEAVKTEIGIVEAYRKWIGKSEPHVGGRVESIMCSCPMPHHTDTNPSAWMNSDLNLWYCAVCDVGGDVLDLAAIRYGYDVNTYKSSHEFTEVLILAMSELGIDTMPYRRSPGEIEPERERIDESEPPANASTQQNSASDSSTQDDSDEVYVDFDAEPEVPFEWESCINEDTFLDLWMQATHPHTPPDEYLFFLGLQMVGLACGPDVALMAEFPVRPNLSLALLGETGIGKSLAVSMAQELMGDALPFDETDMHCRGVLQVGRPASGEALYESFHWIPPGQLEPNPVRGFVEVDELSEFMSASKRRGSTLREAVIQVSDGKKRIHHKRVTGSIEIRSPFCSITTGSQPDALRSIINDHDVVGGFANRFLYVRGTEKPRKPWGTITPYNPVGLDVALRDIHNWAAPGRRIVVEPAAVSSLEILLKRLDEVRKSQPVLARINYLALKLLVVMAANSKSEVVTADMVSDVRVMIEFLIPGGNLVFQQVDQTIEKQVWDRIYTCIEWYPAKYSKFACQRDVLMSFNGEHRKKWKREILQTMARMKRDGIIIPVPPSAVELAKTPRGRKPIIRYEVAK